MFAKFLKNFLFHVTTKQLIGHELTPFDMSHIRRNEMFWPFLLSKRDTYVNMTKSASCQHRKINWRARLFHRFGIGALRNGQNIRGWSRKEEDSTKKPCVVIHLLDRFVFLLFVCIYIRLYLLHTVCPSSHFLNSKG